MENRTCLQPAEAIPRAQARVHRSGCFEHGGDVPKDAERLVDPAPTGSFEGLTMSGRVLTFFVPLRQ